MYLLKSVLQKTGTEFLEVSNLNDGSTDVLKLNISDKCHPGSSYAHGKYTVLDTLWYTHFIGTYWLCNKAENGEYLSHPEILIILTNSSSLPDFPCKVSLMGSEDKLSLCRHELVLRYHVTNRRRYP